MIIRFVRGTAWESTAIAWQEKACMPFIPSHVEALTPDGKFYIGAHMDGGVRARPVGYDAGLVAKLPDGSTCDLQLPLESTPAQDAAFYPFLDSHIGEPYDWRAIIGFLLPEHEHQPQHAICSALITLALRTPGCEWFRWRLAAPAHLVDPRDLLLMLSTHMQIPGI
jgi:hypothetical protein